MEDGGGAEHDVQAGVDLTEDGPKVPAPLHRADHAVGHDYEAHQEVSHGQRHDKGVCGRLQPLEVGDGKHNQEVSHHGAGYPGHDECIQGCTGALAPPGNAWGGVPTSINRDIGRS